MMFWRLDTLTNLVAFVVGALIGALLYSMDHQARLSTACLNEGEIVLQDVTFKCEVKR